MFLCILFYKMSIIITSMNMKQGRYYQFLCLSDKTKTKSIIWLITQ